MENSDVALKPELDDELNALLDSAQEDFSKPLSSSQQPSVAAAAETTNKPTAAKPAIKKKSEVKAASQDGFEHFEEAMKSFLDDDPNFREQLAKLTEAAQAGAGADDDAFAASLAETLKGIAENAQSLSENPSDEELSKVLGNLGLGGGGAEGDAESLPNIIPLMQNVMQSLLSKELLYPALREIVDKYPDWLADKRSSLEQKVYENYNRQYELMKRVCDEFDAERDNDTEQDKKTRFETILKLMQQMQDCGHPPKELVGELGPGVAVDEAGNLKLPNLGGEQCLLM